LYGVCDVLAPVPHKLDRDPRLLEDLAHGSVVWKFVFLDVPAWREPHPQLAVEVQEHFAVPHDEHGDRELPAGLL
jgi:hypothetical protein